MSLETRTDKTGATACGIGEQNTGSGAVYGPERGKIPSSAPVVMIPDYPTQSLSLDQRKEVFAKQKARRLAEQVMGGDEQV
jgi:hypothetical protein